MADPTTGGLDQAGIMAILERLGLGQFANGASPSQGNFGQMALANQTQNGKPAVFDPGTINLQGGGYTDAQLMQGLTQPNSGNGAGRSTSMTNSGGAAPGSQLENDPAWWPKNNKELNAYYAAQTDFQRNQADAITKLLGGLTQSSSAAPPINLATQLPSTLPQSAPVVNGPSGGFTDPTKTFLPGFGPTAALALGSLPSLTSSPLTATQQMINQQNALPSLASQLQSGTLTPHDILALVDHSRLRQIRALRSRRVKAVIRHTGLQ
jgi:hypothetical protein